MELELYIRLWQGLRGVRVELLCEIETP
jgi:hypothetical protein